MNYIKPYVVKNEDGTRSIHHPNFDFSGGISIPTKGNLQHTTIDQMLEAIITCDLSGDELEQLRKDIVGLFLDLWESDCLPEIKTIKG